MLIDHNFAMFASVLGTWLPFLFIFLATYLTGRVVGMVTVVSSACSSHQLISIRRKRVVSGPYKT